MSSPVGKLAALEDRLVTELGPGLNPVEQTVEARRRVIQAREWLRLARQGAEGEQARELGSAARDMSRALAAIEKANP